MSGLVVAVAGVVARPGQVSDNMLVVQDAVRQAAAGGADLVVLPELVASGYTTDAAVLRSIRTPLESVVPAWQALAAAAGVAMIAGLPRFVGGRIFNAAVAIDRCGDVLGWYHKLHLFDAERDVFDPGDLGLPIFEICGLRVGVLICYDLRFMEAMRIHALRDVHVVAVPTAWTPGFDVAPAVEDLVISQLTGALVQANLNQVYVACAGMSGSSGSATRLLGRSAVIDPSGRLQAGPAPECGTHILFANVDRDAQVRARRRSSGIQPLDQRRTDVYATLLGYQHLSPDQPSETRQGRDRV